MSQDRNLADERNPIPYARCRARTGDVYVPRGEKDDPGWLWSGKQRPPELPDEAGAVCVIETTCGGRVRIYPIGGDKEFRRVELDHEWRRA